MLGRVAPVKTDVLEEHIASIIRVTRIGELRTTLAVTRNRSTLQRNTCSSETSVLQDPHGVTSQRMAFFNYLSLFFSCTHVLSSDLITVISEVTDIKTYALSPRNRGFIFLVVMLRILYGKHANKNKNKKKGIQDMHDNYWGGNSSGWRVVPVVGRGRCSHDQQPS
jgi:hypothetical protein